MAMGNPGESKPEQEKRVEERRKKAIALRLAGVSVQAVYDQLKDLGYSSPDHVSMDLKRARERSRAQLDNTVEELRDLQGERLERLLAGVWGAALKGDTRAADTAARLIERICKLRGLEAPTQIALTARIEMESTIVAETLVAVIDGLGLPPDKRLQAIDMAQERMLAIAEAGADEVPA
jgi:hypothetical protein